MSVKTFQRGVATRNAIKRVASKTGAGSVCFLRGITDFVRGAVGAEPAAATAAQVEATKRAEERKAAKTAAAKAAVVKTVAAKVAVAKAPVRRTATAAS